MACTSTTQLSTARSSSSPLCSRGALDTSGVPDKVSIDKNGASKAGVEAYNDEAKMYIELRQCKYSNNIVEPDHRFVKQKTVTILGLQTFQTANNTLTGLGPVHMIRKGQTRPLANGSNVNQIGALGE